MISNQILQNTIEGLKGISRIDFCVLDTEGKALATTFEDTWNYESAVLSFVESPADSHMIQDVSSSRSLMSSSLSMFCWQAERAKMSTCWVRSQRWSSESSGSI